MKATQKVFVELILYKALAGLRGEAARYYLSFLWWLIEPILFMMIFFVVFGLLLQTGTEDFVPFLLIGLVSWQWFSNTIRHSMTSIMEGGRLMTHVHLPKVFFPAVTIVMDTVKFLFVLAILFLFLWWYGYPVTLVYIAFPLVLLVQLVLMASLALLAAAVVPFLPDVRFALDALLQLMFFLSGIFFAGSTLPEEYQGHFYLNPMAGLIEAHRDVLMYGSWPDFGYLAWVAGVSVLMLMVAVRILLRLDFIYPRIVGN